MPAPIQAPEVMRPEKSALMKTGNTRESEGSFMNMLLMLLEPKLSKPEEEISCQCNQEQENTEQSLPEYSGPENSVLLIGTVPQPARIQGNSQKMDETRELSAEDVAGKQGVMLQRLKTAHIIDFASQDTDTSDSSIGKTALEGFQLHSPMAGAAEYEQTQKIAADSTQTAEKNKLFPEEILQQEVSKAPPEEIFIRGEMTVKKRQEAIHRLKTAAGEAFTVETKTELIAEEASKNLSPIEVPSPEQGAAALKNRLSAETTDAETTDAQEITSDEKIPAESNVFRGHIKEKASAFPARDSSSALQERIAVRELSAEFSRLIDQRISRADRIKGSKDLVIHLEPKELGKLVVKLSTSEGVVSVKIVAECSEAKGLLESNLSNLRQSLTDQGIKYGNIEVDLGTNYFQQEQHQQQPEWQHNRQAFGRYPLEKDDGFSEIISGKPGQSKADLRSTVDYTV